MTEPTERSYLPITDAELARLAEIAREDLDDYYRRYPHRAEVFRPRELCIALCQGAAQHYWDRKNGIKDWDVWSFFRSAPKAVFPYRRKPVRAFGDARFGRSIARPEYEGRPVDLLGRSIHCLSGEDFADAIRRYLKASKTETARLLRENAVVVLEPVERRGEVVWPEKC